MSIFGESRYRMNAGYYEAKEQDMATEWAKRGPNPPMNRRRAGEARLIYKAPTGLCVWSVPRTDLQIMWPGPGSGLFLGRPLDVGGAVTRISHRTADGSYDTQRAAAKAVNAFVRVDPEQGV